MPISRLLQQVGDYNRRKLDAYQYRLSAGREGRERSRNLERDLAASQGVQQSITGAQRLRRLREGLRERNIVGGVANQAIGEQTELENFRQGDARTRQALLEQGFGAEEARIAGQQQQAEIAGRRAGQEFSTNPERGRTSLSDSYDAIQTGVNQPGAPAPEVDPLQDFAQSLVSGGESALARLRRGTPAPAPAGTGSGVITEADGTTTTIQGDEITSTPGRTTPQAPAQTATTASQQQAGLATAYGAQSASSTPAQSNVRGPSSPYDWQNARNPAEKRALFRNAIISSATSPAGARQLLERYGYSASDYEAGRAAIDAAESDEAQLQSNLEANASSGASSPTAVTSAQQQAGLGTAYGASAQPSGTNRLRGLQNGNVLGAQNIAAPVNGNGNGVLTSGLFGTRIGRDT